MRIIKLLTLALLFTLAVQNLDPDQSVTICNDQVNGFQRFKQAFNKEYSSAAQQAYAEQAFYENCNEILSGVMTGSFQKALNAKSDQRISDLATKLYFVPGIGKSDQDVQGNQDTSAASAVVSSAKKLVGATCPNNYKSLASSVKDQGSCGACWAFATAAVIESAYNRLNNKVLDLAEEYTLQCTATYNSSATPASTCSGGVIDYALQMLVNTGLPDETTYPYAGYSFGSSSSVPNTISSCSSTSNFHQVKFPTNGSNPLWYRYDNITSSSIETLLTRGTLIVAIYADSTFMSYRSGVFSCPVNFTTAYASINHAVELVGMDCNGNYIVKNSWGTSWGESGYATINPNNDCAISAFVYSYLFECSLSMTFMGILLLLGLLF